MNNLLIFVWLIASLTSYVNLQRLCKKNKWNSFKDKFLCFLLSLYPVAGLLAGFIILMWAKDKKTTNE